jgi:hypothetical protein
MADFPEQGHAVSKSIKSGNFPTDWMTVRKFPYAVINLLSCFLFLLLLSLVYMLLYILLYLPCSLCPPFLYTHTIQATSLYIRSKTFLHWKQTTEYLQPQCKHFSPLKHILRKTWSFSNSVTYTNSSKRLKAKACNFEPTWSYFNTTIKISEPFTIGIPMVFVPATQFNYVI